MKMDEVKALNLEVNSYGHYIVVTVARYYVVRGIV